MIRYLVWIGAFIGVGIGLLVPAHAVTMKSVTKKFAAARVEDPRPMTEEEREAAAVAIHAMYVASARKTATALNQGTDKLSGQEGLSDAVFAFDRAINDPATRDHVTLILKEVLFDIRKDITDSGSAAAAVTARLARMDEQNTQLRSRARQSDAAVSRLDSFLAFKLMVTNAMLETVLPAPDARVSRMNDESVRTNTMLLALLSESNGLNPELIAPWRTAINSFVAGELIAVDRPGQSNRSQVPRRGTGTPPPSVPPKSVPQDSTQRGE